MTSKSKVYLLPFILLDEAYALYTKYVAPMECKFELKKYKKEWSKAYQKLNKALFAHNDEDMVIDMMDSLESEVHNKFVMFRLRVKEMIPDMELSDALSAIYTYTVIVSYAISAHEVIFRSKSSDLEAILFWSTKFLAKLFCTTPCKLLIDPNENVQCQRLAASIWSELASWIKSD